MLLVAHLTEALGRLLQEDALDGGWCKCGLLHKLHVAKTLGRGTHEVGQVLEDLVDYSVHRMDLERDHGEAELREKLKVTAMDVTGPKWPL